MGRNITCKQAVDHMLKKEEGKLSPTQRFQLWRHLASCSLCRIFSVQNKLIAKAYGMQGTGARKLSAEEKQQILESVLNDKSNTE